VGVVVCLGDELQVTQGKEGSSRHARKTGTGGPRGRGETRPQTPFPHPADAGTISFDTSSTRGGGWGARGAGGGWSLAPPSVCVLLSPPKESRSPSSPPLSPSHLPAWTWTISRMVAGGWVVRWVGAVGGWVGGWACVRTREGRQGRHERPQKMEQSKSLTRVERGFAWPQGTLLALQLAIKARQAGVCVCVKCEARQRVHSCGRMSSGHAKKKEGGWGRLRGGMGGKARTLERKGRRRRHSPKPRQLHPSSFRSFALCGMKHFDVCGDAFVC